MRYYTFASFLFLWAALYCVTRAPQKAVRVTGLAVLLLSVLGAVHRWEYKPFPGTDFKASADRFNHARSGEAVTFKTYPEPWTVTLVKH